ncbi:MAG: outer membrane protein assembly factor BamA [Saprospiraceae bacterium]|nr:outer membrane protein assembly factor BamA [Saprospiraceae bacterium]
MSKKRFCLFLFQLFSLGLFAQGSDSLSANHQLEIGGIRFTGNQFSEAAALLSVSGLKVGDRLAVPGPETARALNNLLRLGLFSDVQIFKEKTVGDVVFLEIAVEEQPRLSGHGFRGVKKSRHDDLNEAVDGILTKGNVLTANMQERAVSAIRQFYEGKGFADARVTVLKELGSLPNSQKLVFQIAEGKKLRVQDIAIIGNANVTSRKLLKLLPTKPRRRFWKASKYLPNEWAEGKKAILAHYQSLGFLDVEITGDTAYKNPDGNWMLGLQIKEGRRYQFGQISWSGNSKYSEKELGKRLGIRPGDVYNPERLEQRLRFSPSGDDLTSLYMDDGHLFFQIEPEISSIHGDTIDLKIRLSEGPVAIVDRVTIKGNDRTKEHVIRRELFTEPGKKFSRADLIRSQRQIASLGYFNPEKIEVNTPVNAARGTVDVEYTVEESTSGQQLELAAGWGGPGVGLTGTAGVTLNNFSMKDLFHRSRWNPLPSGDGQSLSFRVQSSGAAYQSYNLSFTEPWLGGKKPNSLTVASFYNRYTNGLSAENTGFSAFSLWGGTVSLGTRLRFPDDNFVSTTALNFNHYRLNNWTSGLFQTDDGTKVTDGQFLNFNLKQTIARSTINQPIFPTSGSKVSLSVALTPPYSLLSKQIGDKLVEYHKWRFDAEFYTSLTKKLVLKTSAKMGYLGSYGKRRSTSPFERFQLGGDALDNRSGGYTGTDIVTMRGYEVADFENNLIDGEQVATPLFNKFTVELRYPLSLNPSATIYALAFAEAGNTYQSFQGYNPFDLKRSAGVGLRVHLPIFGTLGFDYGYGFDNPGNWRAKGRFNITLGVELD